MACPRPSGSFWRTLTSRTESLIRRTCSNSSFFPFRCSWSSSSYARSKWSSMAPLPKGWFIAPPGGREGNIGCPKPHRVPPRSCSSLSAAVRHQRPPYPAALCSSIADPRPGRFRDSRPGPAYTAPRMRAFLAALLDSRFPAQALMASIVDTTSSAVGTGFLFSRWGSGQPGGRGEGWYGALAYSYTVGGGYFLGGETKYYRFATPDGLVRTFAQDVGLLVKRGGFAYGAVVQNVSTTAIPNFPLTSTVGIAWGNDRDWHLAFDYKADLSDLKDVKHRGSGGVEIVLRRRLNGDGFDQFLMAGITLYLE